MSHELWLDTETYSEVPIKHGTHKYTENCEVMIITYAIDDGDVQLVDRTANDPLPAELRKALVDPEFVVKICNVPFDRGSMRYGLGADNIYIPIERCFDVSMQSRSHALPGGLGPLCDILGVDAADAKDKEGKQLIHLFCKPQAKNTKLRRATRHTHPVEWARFCEYAKSDIRGMRAAHKIMPMWNCSPKDMHIWRLDQTINERGFLVDVDLAHAAVEAVAVEQARLRTEVQQATEGEVSSATKRDQMLKYIMEAHGVSLPDMKKATLERRLEDPDLPDMVKQLIAIRLEASGTSVSKYKAIINGVSKDGRLRGTLQFRGAGRTGRWSGRTFQPQNLPRPKYKFPDILAGIQAIKCGSADIILDNVMQMTSSAIRSALIAPPDKKLVVSDLSNIEGRDQAWLAGEEWKLQAFRDFDTVLGEDGNWYGAEEFYALCRRNKAPRLVLDEKGEPVRRGADLYKLAYAKSFQVAVEDVTKDQRQIGKVMELALGYAGGVGAFVTFALAYGIDLDELVDLAWPFLPRDLIQEATEFYDWMLKKGGSTFGMAPRTFIMCDVFKRSWRRAHPRISSYWKELEEVIRQAIFFPGVTMHARKIKVRRDGAWLRLGLPSGRALCYPAPQVDDSGQISYMGNNQYTRKWQRIKSHGGKFFENICQAVACDVMAENMPIMDAAGYEIILTVHDETVTETPDSAEFSVDRLSSFLAAPPVWAADMPLAAAGFEDYRYRKD